MTEIKTTAGKLLFSYDEKITTLKDEISKYKDLYSANLIRADLRGANLKGIQLVRVNLQGADLIEADLFCANLYYANLELADLSKACLRGVEFDKVNLINANLQGADLRGADLYCADLRGADLKGADLSGANLRWADLSGADLKGAILYGTNLSGTKNPPDLPMACPIEGSFIAWKKVNNQFIVKLEVPSDAKRSSATTNKCRCDKAMVLEITNFYTGEKFDTITNVNFAKECTYCVGKMVYPDSFNDNRWEECSHGIHFFMTEEEAKNYFI